MARSLPESTRTPRRRYLLFVLECTIVALVLANTFFTVRNHYVFARGDSTWPVGSWRYHDKIGFEMTPGFSAPMNDHSFYVKSHRLGYRIPKTAPQMEFEPGGVLAIGCSFTYGDEVEAEQTFAYLVGLGLGLPVYNYGVPSYSYASSILQLDDLQQRGILGELRPTVVLLGAGDWLVDRSLSPLYPTTGLPYGYPYIRERGGALAIVQPPGTYAIRRFFDLREAYFPDGTVDDRLTVGRLARMFLHTPRTFAARADERFRIGPAARRIGRDELYRFVIGEIAHRADGMPARLVVLWMPESPDSTIDPALVRAVEPAHLLVDGAQAIRRHGVSPAEFVGRHPSPVAHRAYAAEILAAIGSRAPS